jgi:hypothetical protein
MRQRQLEEENRRLKSIVADQALGIRVLDGLLAIRLRAVTRWMVAEIIGMPDLP